jgi:hypothetical protein
VIQPVNHRHWELRTENYVTSIVPAASIGYHVLMFAILGTLLVRILEGMFAVGLFGSTLVLLITFVEDAETLFGREETHHS